MVKLSNYFLFTKREDPAEAEVISHKLMLRANMIKKLSSGIYLFLPVGWRIFKKLEAIIREEMNKAGAFEIYMPAVHPATLWRQTGRWDIYGNEMLKFTDRNGRECCFGPTHEEVVTWLAAQEVKSWRDLPFTLYQIQVKFRDEIRPRFGVMRSREFIMKDAYSFGKSQDELNEAYDSMYKAYWRIFSRCDLDFKVVEADTGAIGGADSHEFIVLANTGESKIVYCPRCGWAANTERAELKEFKFKKAKYTEKKEINTGEAKTVEEVAKKLETDPSEIAKSVVFTVTFKSKNGEFYDENVMCVVRGDREVNEIKVQNFLSKLKDETVMGLKMYTGEDLPFGNIGPLGFDGMILLDNSLKFIDYFIVGANKEGYHITGIKAGDLKGDNYHWGDFAEAKAGDVCPKCGEALNESRGIEVGHIFKLGIKYSEKLGATFVDKDGKEKPIIMGCYGIGVARTVASIIEQKADKFGCIFPHTVSPFTVGVIDLKANNESSAVALNLYQNLKAKLFNPAILAEDVLLDDRDESPGVKFADADLMGVAYQVVVGRSFVKEGKVELKVRETGERLKISPEEVVDKITEFINHKNKSIEERIRSCPLT